MNSSYKTIMILFIVLFACFSSPVISLSTASFKNTKVTSSTTSNPIFIIGNEELRLMANSSSWLGNGTQSNPFIISDYTINTTYNNGISLTSTTDFIVVSNNTITTNGFGDGIYLKSVSNVAFFNNTIQNSDLGFRIINSTVLIANNTILNSKTTGIRLTTSNTSVIQDNLFSNNYHSSMELYSSSFNEIKNNSIIETIFKYLENNFGAGVYMVGGNNNTIRNNTFRDNQVVGISLFNSNKFNLIESNSINNSRNFGLDLRFTSYAIVRGNTISNTQWGIISHDGSHILIENNTIYGSSMNGISSGGRSNIVRFNFVYSSTGGITAQDSIYSNFYGNNLLNISNRALSITDWNTQSYGSQFNFNNFYDHNPKIFIQNTYNSINGNFWSNYNGTDSNSDGFGEQVLDLANDVPYLTHYSDFHPLMQPFTSDNQSSYKDILAILETIQVNDPTIEITPITTFTIPNTDLSESSTGSNSITETNLVSSSNSIVSKTVNVTYQLILILLLICYPIMVIAYLKQKRKNFTKDKSGKKNIKKFDLEEFFCSSCGLLVNKVDTFCENCGVPIKNQK